jgi:hypothetical protein
MALSPVFEFDNRNVSLVKCLASLRETFGAYGEGMMHSVFDNGFILRLFPLAQKYIVIADIEAGHYIITETSDRFEPEHSAVEVLGFL